MNNESKEQLPFWLRLLYGSGDWGISSVGAMRSLFLAVYLTDIVGLHPFYAFIGAVVGIVWDAINDPIVGMLTDRLQTRWGRRRPFLLWFAIPFGLSFIILWSAPDWESQIALLAYVTVSFMLADTLQTLISVPYLSLTPELTSDYDERTRLTSFRGFFQLAGVLIVSVAAPNIVTNVVLAGGSQQQGYMIVGAIFGFLGAIPLILIALFVREKNIVVEEIAIPFRETLRTAWQNIPFRYGAGIFMLNWSAGDMIILAFQYFLRYWVAEGNLTATTRLNLIWFEFELAIISAFFAVMISICIIFIPVWLWAARFRNKREAYMLGMGVWVVAQLLFFTIQPGQVNYLLLIAALTGVGVSAAYILPDSLFADVIEWDELRTRRRREGIYFGIRAFIRKVAGAGVAGLAFLILGWAGYQNPPEDALHFVQPDSALLAIRLLVSLFGATMLSGAILLAWFFPLSREKHQRIQKLLEKRRARMEQSSANAMVTPSHR